MNTETPNLTTTLAAHLDAIEAATKSAMWRIEDKDDHRQVAISLAEIRRSLGLQGLA